ncbi:hypothetical protein PG997_001908 [Apiospora hydei]|uniref:Threonine/serine exporter-like N-terminal domain-containing protein n=1 Tax=Apiospora hydei TaxID=1337664 RepID=A0ABR1X7V9_9PEZI
MPMSQRTRTGHESENTSVDSLNESNDAGGSLKDQRKLLLKMARALITFGAPSHKIVDCAQDMIELSDLKGFVEYNFEGMRFFVSKPPHPAYTVVQVRANEGIFLGACEDSLRILQWVMSGDMSIKDATDSLNALLTEPAHFESWLYQPLYALTSSFLAVFAFGGSWYDMGPAFLLGGFIKVVQNKFQSRVPWARDISAVFVTTFCAHAFASLGHGELFSYAPVAMSAIVSVLPGYTCLIATRELTHPSSRIVGASHLFNSLFKVVLFGYATQLASSLWKKVNSDPHPAIRSPSALVVDPKFALLLAPLTLILSCVRGGSRLRQIPVQVLVASAAYLVQRIVHVHTTDSRLAMMAGAFTLGVLGNVCALVCNRSAFTSMVIGVQLLVPGGMSLDNELVFVNDMLKLVVPLMVGLLLSALVFSWRRSRIAFLY